MSLIKNIFKSIAILVGVAFLVVFLGFGIMMIFNVEIFGYKWLNAEIAFTATDAAAVSTNKIYIETKGVAVEVRASQDVNAIEFKFDARVQGVVKSETVVDEKKPLNFTAAQNNDVYEITMQEPEGLYFNNSSKLTIWLPNTMSVTDLSIKTGTDDITFGGLNLALDNFSLEASTNLKDYIISDKLTVNQNFKLKTSSGRIYVNSTINGTVELESDLSTFIFSKDVGREGAALSIKGGNPSVEFGDITKENSNVNINSDVAIECKDGGLIKVSGAVKGTITIIDSPHVVMQIEETQKEITATDGFKQLNITNVLGNATINKGDGALYIENCKASKLVVIGNKNVVDIKNLYCSADITNEYGDVNITYSDDLSLLNSASNLKVTTKNSKINVKNINCKVELTSENGNIYAEFAKVIGSNTIITKNQVDVKVKDNVAYDLTTKSKTGAVNVSLGSANYDNWDDAQTIDDYNVKTSAVNGGSNTNSISIQTEGGKISVEILLQD